MSGAVSKLAKLLPLLGSDKPGEVVATAAAIERTLKGLGCDWHDLAALVERHWSKPPADEPKPAPWRDLAQRCLQEADHPLQAAEIEFLQSMAHWRGEPSPKQWKWLTDIAAMLGVGLEAA